MAIPDRDYWLIDLETGRVFGAGTTVIVPEVFGAAAYDIYYDEDLAIEYAEAQGTELELPEGEGIPLTQLDDEPRGYLAIDMDNGNTADASSLVVVPRSGDEDEVPELDDAVDLGKSEGRVPLVNVEVLEAQGLPFESVLDA